MEANKLYELVDVDIIVKVVNIIHIFLDTRLYHKIVFVDEKKRMFFAEI